MGEYRPVAVWSGVVRVTHGIDALAVLFLVALGGMIWADDALGLTAAVRARIVDLHAAIGFVFAASLGVRWALLLGAERGDPASWHDLVPLSPARRREWIATLRYYAGGMRGSPPLSFGHNALAGGAYLGFFVLGALQVLSGAAMYLLAPGRAAAYAHEHGPEVHDDASRWPPEWLHEPHEIGAALIVAFVAAHLTMLVLHELREPRGLISSMVSGKKFFTDDELARMGRNPDEGGQG